MQKVNGVVPIKTVNFDLGAITDKEGTPRDGAFKAMQDAHEFGCGVHVVSVKGQETMQAALAQAGLRDMVDKTVPLHTEEAAMKVYRDETAVFVGDGKLPELLAKHGELGGHIPAERIGSLKEHLSKDRK